MGMYYQTMEIDHDMRLLLFGVAITVISYIYASIAAKDLKKDSNDKP